MIMLHSALRVFPVLQKGVKRIAYTGHLNGSLNQGLTIPVFES
jgi:hypothetical protein